MEIETFDDAAELARATANRVAARLLDAVAAREIGVVAFSGGGTPAAMLAELARKELPWDRIHVVQVDERVAPDGHADRNWTMIRRELLEGSPLPAGNAHPMPVTDDDLKPAAVRYAGLLRALCGEPVVLDVAHLGIGEDGHTASLVPGDAALIDTGLDVTLAGPYQDRVRMTLTFAAINRARVIIWQVEGESKAQALRTMIDGGDVPAAGVRTDGDVFLLADLAAASLI